MQLEALLHTENQVSDYFVLETLLLSTRTADLYKALDKSRGAHISLWVGKGSLGINSGAAREFIDRMAILQRIEPPVSKILSFGVDSTGVPFSVFPNLDGYGILQGNLEGAESSRRFMSALRIVERLHSINLFCGDLCAGSFWVERTGELSLVGVMGLSEHQFVDNKIAPTIETAPYMAPEQIAGDRGSQSSDVFALGLLGYRLLSGRMPAADQEQGGTSVVPLSKAMHNPPVWGNQVLGTCLNYEPQQRYRHAGSILTAINQIRDNAMNAESVPTRVNKDSRSLVLNENTGLSLAKKINSTVIPRAEAPDDAPQQRSLLLRGLVVVFGVFMASFAIFLLLFHKKGDLESEVPGVLSIHQPALTEEQMANLPSAAADSSEKQQYFQKMVASDDPIYHDILIKLAKEARNDKDRFLAETAILDRARRLGLRRSAEIVRPWLRTLQSGNLPPTYDAMLRSLDITLPPEARNSSLRQAYTAYSRMVLKLTAALALDTGKFEQYHTVLAQLIGDASGMQNLEQHSLISLLLFSTDLVSSFGDDAIQRRDQIPDKDIVWLLDVLASRNDINVRAIASAAVERKLLSPMRQLFLASIRDRDDLPLDILNSLVKAAAGKITADDIGNFGNWFDRLSEDILLAICADTPNVEAKLAAFDILAAKSFNREPANSLIAWVRAKAWEKRGEFAEPIGVLSYISYYDEERVMQAFTTFDPYIKDSRILSAFMDSKEDSLVRLTVQRYAKNIGLGRRLNLLGHPDKELRMLAIKSLEGLNDIAGLKIILDYYGREKDPDVRKLYSDTFWVINEKNR